MAREESITTQLTVETYAPEVTPPRAATMPWWMAALGGAVVCVVASWAVGTALVLIAQLVQTGAVTGSAFRLATQLWLLAHGGVFELSGARITLVPLGFTALVALALHGVAGYAGKQARLAGGLSPAQAVGLITVVVTATYGMAVAIVAVVVDAGGPNLRAGLGAAALGLVASFFGARKAARWDCYAAWPVWAKAVPRAIAAGAAIAVLGGATALVVGLIAHRAQFVSMTEQLQPGWGGGIVLALLQLFYIINIIVWGTAYTFGPGFTLGDQSTVSLVGSQIGLLPAFPVTAAVPTGVPSLWNIAWLAFPVLAGAGAAAVVLKARPRARFDETALVGGLSGVLSGVVVAGLAAITRGDLGVARLTGLGPILVPLLVIAPSVMGLGGMLTGFVVGLVRRPVGPTDQRWWSRWGADTAGQSGASSAPEAEPGPGLSPTDDGQQEQSIVNRGPSAWADHPGARLAVDVTGRTQPLPRLVADQAVASDEPEPKLSSVRRWLGRLPKRKPDGSQGPTGAEPTTVDLIVGQVAESTQPMTPTKVKSRAEEQPPLDFFPD